MSENPKEAAPIMATITFHKETLYKDFVPELLKARKLFTQLYLISYSRIEDLRDYTWSGNDTYEDEAGLGIEWSSEVATDPSVISEGTKIDFLGKEDTPKDLMEAFYVAFSQKTP